MRGVYKVRKIITTVTTAKNLLYIECPSDSILKILSAKVTSESENTSERLVVSLARATGTASGGTSITPDPTESGAVASGCTCLQGNSAITGLTLEGDDSALAYFGEEKLAGWIYTPLPEEREIISPSGKLVLATVEDLANSTDLICEVMYQEIGG